MFDWTVRIYYEDTDAQGIVYYANYLRFFERARTEWLRTMGFEQDKLMEQDMVFAVVNANIDYRKPARFNDQLLIKTCLHTHTKASITFAQQAILANDVMCAQLTAKVCCLKLSTLAPRAVPIQLIEEMKGAR